MERTPVAEATSLLKRTFADYEQHKGPWLAAAIAYFTVFSIAPLIIVIVEIAGFALGRHQPVLDEIYGYLQSTAGAGTATAIRDIVTSTFQHRQASIATQIIGWVVFIIATAGLVGSFKQALNTVWNAEPPKHPVLTVLMNQAIAFAIVLVLATLAVLSLFVNAALAAATGALATVSPLAPLIVHAISFFLSFIVIAGVFGLLFEVLPDTRVQWRDVWIGAVVTAFLFVAGQAVLGWYLGVAGIGSTFGIFGSLVIFLLWTNYSAQTVLVGAEFTHVYACTHGSHRAR